MRNRITKFVIPSKGDKYRIKWNGKYVAGLKHLKQLNHSGRFILKNGIVFEQEFMQWIKHDIEFTEHPDAIVMDETFAGPGYDFHPGRTIPISLHAIQFFKSIRSLIKSYGKDKVFLAATVPCLLVSFGPTANVAIYRVS